MVHINRTAGDRTAQRHKLGLTLLRVFLTAEGDMRTLGGGHGTRGPARQDGHAQTQVGGDL
jgi:hypothetical protein